MLGESGAARAEKKQATDHELGGDKVKQEISLFFSVGERYRLPYFIQPMAIIRTSNSCKVVDYLSSGFNTMVVTS